MKSDALKKENSDKHKMAVSADMIKETQASLGKFIKKPPLTEKLLNKPPFRFLHDVFSVVIKDTGALEGMKDCLCGEKIFIRVNLLSFFFDRVQKPSTAHSILIVLYILYKYSREEAHKPETCYTLSLS